MESVIEDSSGNELRAVSPIGHPVYNAWIFMTWKSQWSVGFEQKSGQLGCQLAEKCLGRGGHGADEQVKS